MRAGRVSTPLVGCATWSCGNSVSAGLPISTTVHSAHFQKERGHAHTETGSGCARVRVSVVSIAMLSTRPVRDYLEGVERDSELKQRLQLWETGQINDLICKVLGRTAKRVQPQTDDQRGKRACAFTAQGSISKAMKGLVCGAAQGYTACRRNWTTVLIPMEPCLVGPVEKTRLLHGYPGVELVSRATYISRKKRNLETVQRQSKALKKNSTGCETQVSLHNLRSAMKPLSLF